MFSMSRDRQLPFGKLWGSVNSTFKTPANAALAVGVLAAVPILVIGPLGGYFMSIAATGLIYISYFLCNLGVLAARRRGWPHKPAWFNLGRWGMIVNVLALIYGGTMIVNIALWQSDLFGAFGGEGRAFVNPSFGAFFTPGGNTIKGLPEWPTFEVILITLVVIGAIYYAVSLRGRAPQVELDPASGEAIIG
jgi:amino acid transporter